MMDGYPDDDNLHDPDGMPDCFRPVPANKYAEKLNSVEYYSDDSIRTEGYDPYAEIDLETNNPDKDYDRTKKSIILENVIAFDVQAYDPTAPIYSTTSDGQAVSLLPTDPGWQAAHLAGNAPIGKGAFRNLDPAAADSSSPLGSQAETATYDSWSGAYVSGENVGAIPMVMASLTPPPTHKCHPLTTRRSRRFR